MFDIFFGWRKASKWQLRDDLAELLRNGHYQIVIDRVEQLSLDERKVAMYDLLENYCEFIIINFPYIRRHKDCPSDINEAVSSLIFASARLGDLPELVAIRKLFGERYGQRFENSALQLLPGNLVSHQIMDNICTSTVSEEEKYRLVDEIARSCFQQGPLLLEYQRESQDQLATETSNAAADYKEDGQMRLKDPKITETEGNIVCADYSSKSKKLLKDPSVSHQQLLHTEDSTRFSTTKSCKDSVNYLKDNGSERVLDSERVTGREKGSSAFILEQNIQRRAAESSTEESAELPEQMIYLDDIQEFESAAKKDVNFQDQRLFMFKAPFVPLRLKMDTGSNFEGIEKKNESRKAKERPKGSRKNNTISGKRMRRKSFSVMPDTDSAIYYGDLHESSPDIKPKRQNRRRSARKSSVEEGQKSSTFAHDSKDQPCYVKFRSTLTFVKCIDEHSRSTCSLEHPCYYWITDEKGNGESPFRVPRRRVKATKDFSKCQCSFSQDQHIIEDQLVLPPQQIPKTNEDIIESMRVHVVKPNTEDVSESQETCNSTMSSTSGMTYQRATKENQAHYLRAMTMPIERPKDGLTDNFLRSSSFLVQEAGNGSSENRHVHPKLPDYDDIAAKFLALKKEKLQKKC